MTAGHHSSRDASPSRSLNPSLSPNHHPSRHVSVTKPARSSRLRSARCAGHLENVSIMLFAYRTEAGTNEIISCPSAGYVIASSIQTCQTASFDEFALHSLPGLQFGYQRGNMSDTQPSGITKFIVPRRSTPSSAELMALARLARNDCQSARTTEHQRPRNWPARRCRRLVRRTARSRVGYSSMTIEWSIH